MDMTLKDRIIRLIESGGPIPVSTYMQLALHDPQQGYYAARPGLGRDFITAPETSQIFGELIGLWIVNEWKAMGSPDLFHLVEIGPGRGVLMQDALRLAFVAGGPEFANAMNLILIEPSKILQEEQVGRLGIYAPTPLGQLANTPPGPMILVANEYLDCLPARQFRHDGAAWRECVVGLDPQGMLAFGLAADEQSAPQGAAQSAKCVELQSGLDLVLADLAVRDRFRALFIDYGPAETAPGDSLRAFYQGQQVHPLERPGEADLTVDVDFSRFKRLALAAGLDVSGPTPQGMFLLGLGAQARLNQLVKANEDDADTIYNAAQRLIDPKQMGERFKAICLSSQGLPAPAGF